MILFIIARRGEIPYVRLHAIYMMDTLRGGQAHVLPTEALLHKIHHPLLHPLPRRRPDLIRKGAGPANRYGHRARPLLELLFDDPARLTPPAKHLHLIAPADDIARMPGFGNEQ